MRKTLSILLAVAMTLAMMSGLVLFEASAADEVHTPMPGLNQYSVEQMQKMATNLGEDYEFSKDENGHTLIAAIPVSDGYGSNVIHFATAETFNQWNQNKLIDGLSPFGGVDLSNKTGFRFKVVMVKGVEPSYVGFCFGSTKKHIAIDFRRADYNAQTGYYEVNWSKTGWYGVQIQGDDWYKDCASIADTYYASIDQFQFKLEYPESQTRKVTFYVDDMYAFDNVATDDLHKAIERAQAYGDFDPDMLEEAVDLYKTSSNQTAIDDMTNQINGILDAIEAAVTEARDQLNSLLDEADMLGFFDPENENFDLACEADLLVNGSDATLEDYNRYIKYMRDVVWTEYMEDDLADLLKKLDSLWAPNYTPESYAAAVAAAEEVWADYEAEDALEKAQAAYDSLVKISTEAVTDNLFAGWDAAAVNDVVDANSTKLCDSIGDGLNKKDVWNAGDFTNNTAFDADDGWFSMTAQTSFLSGAMGWKNMDRSGTLAGKANEGYPVLNLEGIDKADGIRFKLTVEDGTFRRMLIGLSNCADLSNEMYAKNIPVLAPDDEGYINLPFSAFEAAWWSNKFSPDLYSQIAVFIVEAYGAKEGTCVKIEDIYGYVELQVATAEDIASLSKAVTNLSNFDIDGRYVDLIKEGSDLVEQGGFKHVITDAKKRINAVLAEYSDPEGVVVDVPGYSIYTNDEVRKFMGRSAEFKCERTENGMKIVRKSGTGAQLANGVYGGVGDGYEEGDTSYGPITAINGKTFIDMLGGYKLSEIVAFRFMIEGGSGKAAMRYKDGVGLWGGLATNKHETTKGEDGYYTYYMSDIPTSGMDGWYSSDFTLEEIREMTKFLLFDSSSNFNKNIYGWQIILAEGIDRTGLKKVVENVPEAKDDALNLYYDSTATQAQIDEFVTPYLKLINKPDAPQVDVINVGITEASLTDITGVEYKLGEGKWQTSNTFTGLEADTDYTAYARYAETDTAAASDETPVTFRTNPYTFGDASIEVQGDAVYGATLTAVSTDIPAELEGQITIIWTADGEVVGTGDTFEITDSALVGKTIVASIKSDLVNGSVDSDPTAQIAKAQPQIITLPTATPVVMGEPLSTSNLEGGEASVAGTWKFANPNLVLTLQQSGSKVDVYFIPEDAAAYETVKVSVEVNILAETDTKVLTNAELGITISGEFFNQAVTGDTIEFEAIEAGTAAYLDLLRAAKYSQSENNMVFLYTADFNAPTAYLGTLEFTTKLSMRYACMEYTFWFFADGQVTSYTTVVGEDGTVTLSDIIL